MNVGTKFEAANEVLAGEFTLLYTIFLYNLNAVYILYVEKNHIQ
jgi:hypothetical protein